MYRFIRIAQACLHTIPQNGNKSKLVGTEEFVVNVKESIHVSKFYAKLIKSDKLRIKYESRNAHFYVMTNHGRSYANDTL